MHRKLPTRFGLTHNEGRADLLYHGSDRALEELTGDNPHYSGSLGWGLYLTSSPEHAAMYGRYLHEVRQPVPDELVADLTDLVFHGCGDSLVLGTPDSSPFTFDVEDRKTGELHRYSVLENCDYQVKGDLRRDLLDNELSDAREVAPELAKQYGQLPTEHKRLAVVAWEDLKRRLAFDDELRTERAMEDVTDDIESELEGDEDTTALRDFLADLATALDAKLSERMGAVLGDEIDLDDLSATMARHGYSAFHIDGYAPGGDEFVIVDEAYLPVPVERVSEAVRRNSHGEREQVLYLTDGRKRGAIERVLRAHGVQYEYRSKAELLRGETDPHFRKHAKAAFLLELSPSALQTLDHALADVDGWSWSF